MMDDRIRPYQPQILSVALQCLARHSRFSISFPRYTHYRLRAFKDKFHAPILRAGELDAGTRIGCIETDSCADGNEIWFDREAASKAEVAGACLKTAWEMNVRLC